MLTNQILSEQSNYDLSMLYLENLLKHDPNNESFMIVLAEQSLKSGKKDLSLRLLAPLLKSENVEHRNKAILLSYDLKKDDYFYFKDEEKKKVQKENLRELFHVIMSEKLHSEANIDKWYKESIFLEEYKSMYQFIEKKLILEPDNIALIKQAYYVSIELSHKEDSLKYISILSEKDKVDEEKWLIAEYHMLIQYKLYSRADKLLSERAGDTVAWKNRYAEFNIVRKSYVKASKIYMQLFNTSSDYKTKKDYFYKAINALQAGKHLNKTVNLAHKYENYYIKDSEMRKYLLKLYMATNRLDRASSLSSKILKREIR